MTVQPKPVAIPATKKAPNVASKADIAKLNARVDKLAAAINSHLGVDIEAE